MPRLIVHPPKRLWTPPRPVPTPTEADVERYKRLRAAGKRLNTELTATIPKRAMDDIGEALGIVHGGVFVFDSEHVTSVLMDCCLYDWVEGGKNVVQQFAEKSPPPEGTDEREVLDAKLRARYSILKIEKCMPGAGARAADLVRGRELFVMDMALSSCSGIEGGALATRIIPMGEFWMTGGAILPIGGKTIKTVLIDLLHEYYYETRIGEAFDVPDFILAVVRSCLEDGAAERVRHEDPDEADPEAVEVVPRALPRRPSRNAPCPCGSGRKYKRCCGTGERRRRSA